MKRKDKYIQELEKLAVESGPVRAWTDEENIKFAKDMAWTQKDLNETSSCNRKSLINISNAPVSCLASNEEKCNGHMGVRVPSGVLLNTKLTSRLFLVASNLLFLP